MKLRIVIWAGIGFLVSGGWGLYFATSDKAIPIGPIVYILARLTEPLVAVTVPLFNFPLGLRGVAVANAATYAMTGLIMELTKPQWRRGQLRFN